MKELFTVCPMCSRLATLMKGTTKCRACLSEYQAILAIRKTAETREEYVQLLADRVPKMLDFTCTICNEPLRGYKYDEINDDAVCQYCYAIHRRMSNLSREAFEALTLTIMEARVEDWQPLEEKPIWKMRGRPGPDGVWEDAMQNEKTREWQDQAEYDERMRNGILAKVRPPTPAPTAPAAPTH